MGSNWKTLTLGDVTTWSSGGTPKKMEPLFWGGKIPWISASSMNGHLYSDSKLKITEEGLKNGSRLAPEGSILLLVRGSILHQKMQVGLATKPVSFNQDVKCLIVNEEKIDAWFLLLWFKAKERELLSIVESTGIGAGKFDTQVLLNYPIEIPPQEERNRIRDFGKALFDKIQLNQQTNQTLEQMAQTLFKSWFVDFDPVFDNLLAKANFNLANLENTLPEPLFKKAKARLSAINASENVGNIKASLIALAQSSTPQLSSRNVLETDATSATILPQHANTHAHFPSEFEHNEQLGWIPKGWECNQLDDVVEIASSKRVFAKDYVESGVPFYRGKEITELSLGKKVNTEIFITEDKYQELKLKAGAPKAGDILITSVGTIGNAYLVHQGDKFYFKDGNLTWIKDYKKSKIPHYLLTWLKNPIGKSAIENIKIGTTQQAITIKSLNKIKLVVPTSKVSELFESFGQTTCDKLVANNNQNNALVRLRDTLLPKLTSGEITLTDSQISSEA